MGTEKIYTGYSFILGDGSLFLSMERLFSSTMVPTFVAVWVFDLLNGAGEGQGGRFFSYTDEEIDKFSNR